MYFFLLPDMHDAVGPRCTAWLRVGPLDRAGLGKVFHRLRKHDATASNHIMGLSVSSLNRPKLRKLVIHEWLTIFFLKKRMAHYWAVCRNNQGNFVAASAMVIPNIIDPETLKTLAYLEALALAEDCGIRKLLVASDCLNVVKNIKDIPRCSYMMILQDIFQRSKSCQYVRFVHEGREGSSLSC